MLSRPSYCPRKYRNLEYERANWFADIGNMTMGLLGRFALIMVAFGVALPAFGQEVLESGKSPAQIFASDCAVCHKSPQGLARSGGIFGLSNFLREHYTSSRETAAALSAYLQSLDVPAAKPQPQRRNAAKPGEGSKPAADRKPAAKPGEAKPENASATAPAAAPPPPPAAETKPPAETPPEAKPSESKPAENPGEKN